MSWSYYLFAQEIPMFIVFGINLFPIPIKQAISCVKEGKLFASTSSNRTKQWRRCFSESNGLLFFPWPNYLTLAPHQKGDWKLCTATYLRLREKNQSQYKILALSLSHSFEGPLFFEGKGVGIKQVAAGTVRRQCHFRVRLCSSVRTKDIGRPSRTGLEAPSHGRFRSVRCFSAADIGGSSGFSGL